MSLIVTTPDTAFEVTDERTAAAVRALLAAQGGPSATLAAAIATALRTAMAAGERPAFELAAAAQEEFAVRYVGVSVETARAASAQLRRRAFGE